MVAEDVMDFWGELDWSQLFGAGAIGALITGVITWFKNKWDHDHRTNQRFDTLRQEMMAVFREEREIDKAEIRELRNRIRELESQIITKYALEQQNKEKDKEIEMLAQIIEEKNDALAHKDEIIRDQHNDFALQQHQLYLLMRKHNDFTFLDRDHEESPD